MRELEVRPEDEQFFDREGQERRIGWKKGQERPWAHLILLQCARRLTGLRYIEMWNVDLSPSHPLAILSGRYYHSLTQLDLSYCTFAGIVQLHQFVTSFPALSNLRLVYLDFYSKIVPSQFPKGGNPLTRLELWLYNDAMTMVSRWLSRTQLVRHLQFLDWRPHNVENAAEEGWKTLTDALDCCLLQRLVMEVDQPWQGQSRFLSILSFYSPLMCFMQLISPNSPPSNRCTYAITTPNLLMIS